MALLGIVAVTALGVALTLVARSAQQRWLTWLAKPLASMGFMAMALWRGALESDRGQLMLLALALCFVGDMLLIPRARRAFLAGLISFLLGHAVYAFVFVSGSIQNEWLAIALLPVAASAVLVLRWIWPHVPAQMRPPVLCYVVVIGTMLICAAGGAGGDGPLWLLPGALLFYLSDIAVARERFVAEGLINRLWGLPLYYAGQLLLAWCAGAM